MIGGGGYSLVTGFSNIDKLQTEKQQQMSGVLVTSFSDTDYWKLVGIVYKLSLIYRIFYHLNTESYII